jgi:hypothetical protein
VWSAQQIPTVVFSIFYTELQLATLNYIPPFIYILLCFCQCISDHAETYPILKEDRSLVHVTFSWTSCNKTATLAASRVTVSKAIHKSWEDNFTKEKQWAKINTDKDIIMQ